MANKAFFLLRMNDHVQYLRKIEATLQGTGDFQGTDCHECKLGKWLYGDGAAEAEAAGAEAKQVFDSIFEPHQLFHEASHNALQQKQSGDEGGSREAMTTMYKLSKTLIDMLLTLDRISK